jgi:hypothetical protein
MTVESFMKFYPYILSVLSHRSFPPNNVFHIDIHCYNIFTRTTHANAMRSSLVPSALLQPSTG